MAGTPSTIIAGSTENLSPRTSRISTNELTMPCTERSGRKPQLVRSEPSTSAAVIESAEAMPTRSHMKVMYPNCSAGARA